MHHALSSSSMATHTSPPLVHLPQSSSLVAYGPYVVTWAICTALDVLDRTCNNHGFYDSETLLNCEFIEIHKHKILYIADSSYSWIHALVFFTMKYKRLLCYMPGSFSRWIVLFGNLLALVFGFAKHNAWHGTRSGKRSHHPFLLPRAKAKAQRLSCSIINIQYFFYRIL